MRSIRPALAVALTVCLFAPLAIGLRPAAASDALRSRADALVDAPLDVFLRAKAQAVPPFDWTDDGCSRAPDRPMGFDFAAACRRHDFGYRNFGHGLRLDPTEARRARLDARFHADLLAACVAVVRFVRSVCQHLAWLYVQAVRHFGRAAFLGR
jgi:hypothetical protein